MPRARPCPRHRVLAGTPHHQTRQGMNARSIILWHSPAMGPDRRGAARRKPNTFMFTFKVITLSLPVTNPSRFLIHNLKGVWRPASVQSITVGTLHSERDRPRQRDTHSPRSQLTLVFQRLVLAGSPASPRRRRDARVFELYHK